MNAEAIAELVAQALSLISTGTSVIQQIEAMKSAGGATDDDLKALQAQLAANSAKIQAS